MRPFPSSYALTLPHLKYDLPENLGKPTVQLQKTTSIAVTQNIFHSSPVRPLPDGFFAVVKLESASLLSLPPFLTPSVSHHLSVNSHIVSLFLLRPAPSDSSTLTGTVTHAQSSSKRTSKNARSEIGEKISTV